MKLKYKFKVYHLLETYPTSEDILFEIVQFLSERKKIDQEWSDLGIKGAFSQRFSEQQISSFLDTLVEEGHLSKRNGAGKRNYFKVINIPTSLA